MFCSDQDPGGLLLLPEKGVSADFDISEVLSVMETLLLVAAREVSVFALFLFLLLCCDFCLQTQAHALDVCLKKLVFQNVPLDEAINIC